jgi:Smg protein
VLNPRLERESMKQTVVDVLMYLFENIIGDETHVDPERDLIVNRLEQLGFPQREILRAFNWLEDLADIQYDPNSDEPGANSTRIYSDQEKLILDQECIGFLISLEETGILTPITRELILDSVVTLDVELDIEELKWIAMIVLYSYPGEENAYLWMESMVFDQFVNYMH